MVMKLHMLMKIFEVTICLLIWYFMIEMSDVWCIPQDIIDEANEAVDQLLPPKSRERYEGEYFKFKEWMKTKNVQLITEEVMLAYIFELSKTYNPASMWSKFSMLKSCLEIKDNVNIKSYQKCISFLKRKYSGYSPNKAKILTAEEVSNFMNNASDESWLLTKVLLAFGIFGSCRVDELVRMRVSDVNDNGNFILVFIQPGKTNKGRSFIITNNQCTFNACDVYRKYRDLRPKNMKTDRLFICLRNGKCINQNVGYHTISDVPKKVAIFLKLDNPEQYTGHCLRRSSASILVESGADILTLKRHGGWKSSTVAEGYIEDSKKRKLEVASKMFSDYQNSIPHTSNTEMRNSSNNSLSNDDTFFTVDDLFQDSPVYQDNEKDTCCERDLKLPPKAFNISNNTNCTINININM